MAAARHGWSNGYKAIREFLRHAATLGTPPATAEDITPAAWAGWRLSRPTTVYGRTCLLITRQWLPKVPASRPPPRRQRRGASRTAGHGVAVLLKVYANCVDGQASAANQRISDALDSE